MYTEHSSKLLYSVQSSSVVSNSLRPHELQRTRPPCPSPTPGVHPNPCPLSQWCHPTILSSIVPFSSCLQSLPASGSFPMSQLFTSGGQSIGVSASASGLPMDTQDWSPLGWTGWISLQSKGLSRVFSITTVQNINSSVLSFLYSPTLTSIHDHWTLLGRLKLTRKHLPLEILDDNFAMISAIYSADERRGSERIMKCQKITAGSRTPFSWFQPCILLNSAC